MTINFLGPAALGVFLAAGVGVMGCDSKSVTPVAPSSASPQVAALPVEPPSTLDLPVLAEGAQEMRTGSRERSANGYVIYVLERYAFAPAKPGADLLTYKPDDRYRALIERLDPEYNVQAVRENAAEALSALGNVRGLDEKERPEEWRDARFVLRASSPTLTRYVLVASRENVPFRLTVSLPRGEDDDAVEASLRAMLQSIRIRSTRPGAAVPVPPSPLTR